MQAEAGIKFMVEPGSMVFVTLSELSMAHYGSTLQGHTTLMPKAEKGKPTFSINRRVYPAEK